MWFDKRQPYLGNFITCPFKQNDCSKTNTCSISNLVKNAFQAYLSPFIKTGTAFDRHYRIKCNIVMKRTFLGEFEEVILLTVAILGEEAYGVTVTQELEQKTRRAVGFSTVHTTLQRLEEKGFLSSEMGGATAERGGRRKRFFKITAFGRKALREVKEIREELWGSLPPETLRLMGI